MPHVTHTTVPIHEVHHNEAKHHAASALPAVSMEQFKKQGGATGKGENIEVFEGHPHALGEQLSGSRSSKLGHQGDAIECSCGTGIGQNCKLHPQSHGGHGATRETNLDQAGATGGQGLSGTHHQSSHTGTGGALSSQNKPLPQPGINTAGATGAAGSANTGGSGLGRGSGSRNQTSGLGSTAGSSTGTPGGHRDADGIIRVPAGSSQGGPATHSGLGDSTHGSGVTGGTSSHVLSDTPEKKPGMLDRLREKMH